MSYGGSLDLHTHAHTHLGDDAVEHLAARAELCDEVEVLVVLVDVVKLCV
jgi:hypothetical protein